MVPMSKFNDFGLNGLNLGEITKKYLIIQIESVKFLSFLDIKPKRLSASMSKVMDFSNFGDFNLKMLKGNFL